MRRRRGGGSRRREAAIPLHELCRGPGDLSRALGISLRHNRADLTAGLLRVEDRGLPERRAEWSRRIGITVGTEPDWRCTAVDSPAVSGRRRRTP